MDSFKLYIEVIVVPDYEEGCKTLGLSRLWKQNALISEAASDTVSGEESEVSTDDDESSDEELQRHTDPHHDSDTDEDCD